MLGVDAEVLPGFDLDEPCELHDRAPRGVEDDPLDFPDFPPHSIAVSGVDGYLRRGSHGAGGPWLELMSVWFGVLDRTPADGSDGTPGGRRFWQARMRVGIGCYGQNAGVDLAREVLLRRRSESPPNPTDRAGEGREFDGNERAAGVRAVSAEPYARHARTESGLLDDIGSIVRRTEVTL